ncbi:alpha/beta hydrolase [Pseudonocardia sp.]|uniref:alpha/beta hydrolase n=1 Tax=Pseudonocardia sp. TaxID=60912 RepID=UPI003D11418B
MTDVTTRDTSEEWVAPQPSAGDRARAAAAALLRAAAGQLRFTLPGAWGVVIAVCLSLTPSLLPRDGLIQGVVAGLSGWIGYGVGVLAAAIWRAFADRGPRAPRPGAWRAFLVAGGLALLVFAGLGRYWQTAARALLGLPPEPLPAALLSVPVAVVVFAVLLLIGRGVGRAGRALGEFLGRRMGRAAARTLGWAVVALTVVGLLDGVLVDGLLNAADRTFAAGEALLPEDGGPPASPLRSGGPGSLAPWETLGRQGRAFVTDGPTAAEISALRARPALEPVRIYAGLSTAPTTEERARTAVADLERAGGFARANLLVATTTGTGWLEPGSMAAYETLADGDSAIVSMQYSYLPSGFSFLVDQVRARDAGRELFDAVYERWSALPEGQRPRLYVFGESLGAFGMEGAFSGEADLRNRTSGALFVGAPAFATLHQRFTEERDPGSPAIEPVHRGGRTVRFATEIATGAPPRDVAWTGTRVLYLQHPSDPITFWSPSLLLSRPDWLAEPAGRDVLDAMVWIPVVTFWQVTLDMPPAVGVPEGHGHRYTGEVVDAWAMLLQPEGLTPESAAAILEASRGFGRPAS